MSFEGMIERSRLSRLPDDTTLVAVVITGTTRYEQDQQGLHANVRYTFPEFGASEKELVEWADRVI